MRKILMSLIVVLLAAAIWGGATLFDRHRDQTETIEKLRYELTELKTMIARSEEPQDSDSAVQAGLEQVRTAHQGNAQHLRQAGEFRHAHLRCRCAADELAHHLGL